MWPCGNDDEHCQPKFERGGKVGKVHAALKTEFHSSSSGPILRTPTTYVVSTRLQQLWRSSPLLTNLKNDFHLICIWFTFDIILNYFNSSTEAIQHTLTTDSYLGISGSSLHFIPSLTSSLPSFEWYLISPTSLTCSELLGLVAQSIECCPFEWDSWLGRCLIIACLIVQPLKVTWSLNIASGISSPTVTWSLNNWTKQIPFTPNSLEIHTNAFQ